jgi:hypothetical protein
MSEKNISDNPRCCVEHMQRRGYGFIDGERFIINGNHLREGQRAICSVCHRVWIFSIDESGQEVFMCYSLIRENGEKNDI